MSNRVSPAPASSPLPPVDSPIPDDLELSPYPPPPPPPPLLSDDDNNDDNNTTRDDRNAYMPVHVMTEDDMEQAVYDPPPPPPLSNYEGDVNDDRSKNNPASPLTNTTNLSDTLTTEEQNQTYTKFDHHSENAEGNIDNTNANGASAATADDEQDDTVYPVGITSSSTAAAAIRAATTNDENGDDDDEEEAGDGEERGETQVRQRVIGRLAPIQADGEGSAGAVPATHGGEAHALPSTGETAASWGHYTYQRQQQQQQQQGYFGGDFNPSQQHQQQQQQQQQHFAMSARPNSGISRKDHEDGTVIGANNSVSENGFCAILLTILSYIMVVLFLPFSLCVTFKVVQEYERAVIFRLGRLLPGGAKGPGIFFVMPCIEEYTKVDLRTVSFDVPPQEVLTRDSVTVSVDAVVYYRISNPTVSVANVENAANSTQLLAQTTLRNVLGTQNLAEILSNREHISEQMQIVLDGATDKWGIKVERVEIKDVRLPTQLQRAMATEAEAARDARAKVIAAEGEQKASVALREAAEIIADTPAAMQLRYLQTLNSISAEKNSTIIFPIPIELIGSMIKK